MRAPCARQAVCRPPPPCRRLQVTYCHGSGTKHTVTGLLSARDAGIVCDALLGECAGDLGRMGWRDHARVAS
jgi:hypothetical protein